MIRYFSALIILAFFSPTALISQELEEDKKTQYPFRAIAFLLYEYF